MTTLMIAYFVICIVLLTVVIATEIFPTEKFSIWTKEIVLAIVLVALGFIMLFIPTRNQRVEVIGNAVLMEHFEDASLYYDESNDMYFAVETNKWNPFEMYKRVDIPQELAKQKLAAATTSVFETENIKQITFYTTRKPEENVVVSAKHMEEISAWLGTFFIGEKVGNVEEPGTDSISVKIEYLDGTIVDQSLSTVTVGRNRYYMKHEKEPVCYFELWNNHK